jgi:hypothetical protein
MTGKIGGEQDEKEGTAAMQELMYQAAKAVACWGYAGLVVLALVVISR